MSTPFLGEIKIVSFSFAPKGWAFCNGQLLPINQNQALFALLGTTYGGDGRVNFALPDLRGRVPVHFGAGFVLGEMAGEEAHTLTIQEMPAHSHPVTGSSNSADQASGQNNFWANTSSNAYSSTADSQMALSLVNSLGGGQAHTNLSPYLTLSFCIALQGIFPSQN
jgi:microcystin-dependent protein